MTLDQINGSDQEQLDKVKDKVIQQRTEKHEKEMNKLSIQMNSISPSKNKKLSITEDDVFAEIFLPTTTN